MRPSAGPAELPEPFAPDSLVAGLVEGVPLPAFVISDEEFILAANAPALALLGAGARGRSLALFLRAPELFAAIEALRGDGQKRSLTIRLPGEAQYEASLSPLPGDGLVLCVLRDLSDERQNAAIRRDFVANVSHELRTPLTALMGFIETLQTTAKGDPRAQERFLAIMESEAARMNRLVRDLLQLSRVEASERMRPRDPVDITKILQTVMTTMRPRAEAGGGQIRLEAQPDLPMLPGDGDQLLQVFLNLTENAVKYGAKGGQVTLRLSLQKTSVGPTLLVEVADEGEGIDPVHLPRLTERFYRIDSHRSRAEGGTGLGLAIVKHIINRHRGRLKITSRKGGGSVFSVFLPVN